MELKKVPAEFAYCNSQSWLKLKTNVLYVRIRLANVSCTTNHGRRFLLRSLKFDPFWRRFGSKGNVALARPVRNRNFYNFSFFEIKSPCLC